MHSGASLKNIQTCRTSKYQVVPLPKLGVFAASSALHTSYLCFLYLDFLNRNPVSSLFYVVTYYSNPSALQIFCKTDDFCEHRSAIPQWQHPFLHVFFHFYWSLTLQRISSNCEGVNLQLPTSLPPSPMVSHTQQSSSLAAFLLAQNSITTCIVTPFL